MSMTLEQMEAIATDLDRRVSVLEDRREPASFAPQNSYYIDPEGNTIDGSAIHQVVEDQAGPFNFIAETNNGWNALSVTLAEVNFEVLTPEDVIRVYGLLEASWSLATGAQIVSVDLLLDGAQIEGWTINGVKHTITATIKTVGSDAKQLFWLDGGFHESGGEGAIGFPNVIKSNGPNSFPKGGPFIGTGLGLLVGEGEHTISLHARPAQLTPSGTKYEKPEGWILQAPMLAVRY